ncbi:MAG: amphi-Trp domain-containing protein [Candidatus Syntrophonatronum acetioxidans]|uniref:Amphi-Trp domain-containing protein n=1 Tax=Candidatus Syntrophonatronum acetioxidans TaxID=1795816 RepID=A0A424YFH0_9FIRM|nr:MAG: amphi-Trp domain-containing protein [Candidatus Syntrophonatronum acetioxidans]
MSGAKEEVIFSSEEPRSVSEIGDFLIQAGQKLKEQGFFTLTSGDKQLEVRPEGATKLELKYEIEGAKHEFEIEIEWKPGVGGPGSGKVDIT